MNTEELREIMRLDKRAKADKIPESDIVRQEQTVLRAHELLAGQPGVVLADEVGMGKTFEALGLAALAHHFNPRAKIVVITPGRDLNTKWEKEIQLFAAIHDFATYASAHTLGEFVAAAREKTVTITPMTVFQTGRSSSGQKWLLSMYFCWKQLHGRTRNAAFRRYRDGELEPVNVHAQGFLGRFDFGEFSARALARAFRRGKQGRGYPGVDDLYEAEGLDAFHKHDAVARALHRARTVLAGSLLPTVDLLIVDEAHKLKSSGALKTQGLRAALTKRYRKALFLTATPFQLEVGELREVFRLFEMAKGAPKDLGEQIEELLASIRAYQARYDEFQSSWARLAPEQAQAFGDFYRNDPALAQTPDDPSLVIVTTALRELLELKQARIEPGLRRWMIRSLREHKRSYRDHRKRPLNPHGGAPLPFLIYERFIAELFRRPAEGGTHKAAVQINMVSSYAAARGGALLADSSTRQLGPDAEAYRDLLRGVLDHLSDDEQHHAKLGFSVQDALAAAQRDEKTLVFCTRVATLTALKNQLDSAWVELLLKRWRAVYPDIEASELFSHEDDEGRSRGRHAELSRRFHAHGSRLYLALRERYLHTVLPIAGWARDRVDELLEPANARLRDLRVGKTTSERRDFKLAKRCVEHAAAVRWCEAGSPSAALTGTLDERGYAALLNPEFVSLGLDLERDELENDEVGEQPISWTIDSELALTVIGDGRSLWAGAAELLAQFDNRLRVRLVERLARYLCFGQVPFLAELLGAAKAAGVAVESIDASALLHFIDGFWARDQGARWHARIFEFLRYFIDRTEEHREVILSEVLDQQKVAFARHTRSGDSRERLREAFNTPLFPMVLIANEVMQEGLDLHRSCRRVIHHDLAWNPAQLEQRVGRVDRLGSRLARLREQQDEAAMLEVMYPLIRGTIDERLYEVVRRREKWLEFLLGAPPNLREYGFGDEEPPPLPDGLADRLAIGLAPVL